MNVCPECERVLPWGTAFRRGVRLGLPDKRELDCPYCGAPLEPIRWTTLAVLFLILAVALTARKLIAPLLDWRAAAVLIALVVAHHVIALLRWRKARREKDALGRFTGRDS